jgi:hypothetical protein
MIFAAGFDVPPALGVFFSFILDQAFIFYVTTTTYILQNVRYIQIDLTWT